MRNSRRQQRGWQSGAGEGEEGLSAGFEGSQGVYSELTEADSIQTRRPTCKQNVLRPLLKSQFLELLESFP